MIIIDTAEKPYVFKMFDKLGIPYEKEEIRIPDKCPKIPLRWEKGDLTCVSGETVEIMKDFEVSTIETWEKDTMACIECEKRSLRIGDFTNDKRGFIAERKRVDDFYSSMADGRLYDQARKMYQWCSGLKIIILEGMGTKSYIEDGFNPFDSIDEIEEIQLAKSPIQQLLDMKPDKPEWIWGMVTDLATCEVALCQTQDLEETAMMVKWIAEGAGNDPKIRSIPKKIAGLSLEQQMLTVIPGIGKARAQNIIAEYGSLGKLISAMRKMKKVDANKHSITKKLKEVFK